MTNSTDRIEKEIVLRAPIGRVWRAISDSQEFGIWFGVEFEGPFSPGSRVKGRIVPTKVDPKVAEAQKPYVGMTCDVVVERIESEHLFSFRWHPGAVEPADVSSEPTTLVTFELREVAEGTLLTITESGFDGIPLARRAQAFSDNEQGWAIQTKLIEKHLADAA